MLFQMNARYTLQHSFLVLFVYVWRAAGVCVALRLLMAVQKNVCAKTYPKQINTDPV